MSPTLEPAEEMENAGKLRRLMDGFQVTQALHVAAVLGVVDELTEEPRGCAEIAQGVGAHAGALYRLLRLLAALGVIKEHADQRFSLAPLGTCLLTDAPGSLRPYAVFAAQPNQWQAWGQLLHSVKTGANAFRVAHGKSAWEYRAADPEQNAVFNAAMTGNSQRVESVIVAALDWSQCRTVVDVGGGQGALLAAILRAHPGLRGTLFDQAHVVRAADTFLGEAGVRDRVEVHAGDMFHAVPSGADVYVMKHILHDWEDADAARVLGVCRRSLAPHSRLVIVENLLGPPNTDVSGKLGDLHMLVSPGGVERTAEEFRSLLHSAGFQLEQVVDTTSGLSLLCCTAAPAAFRMP